MKKYLAISMIIIMLLASFTSCNSTDNLNLNQNTKYTKQIETPIEVEKKIYKNIVYNTQGGSNISTQSVEQGSQLNDAPIPTKTDHTFDGWYLDQTYTQGATFPMIIDKDVTLYAKWLKTKETINCVGCTIDSDIIHTQRYSYDLTPTGMDLDRLSILGYRITVNIDYKVYYTKDYNVAFDIGYMGSPKYEISIADRNDIGIHNNNQSTSTSQTTRNISKTYTPLELKNNGIKLSVSSDNIQNKIHFTEFVITYTCIK